jgi:hypothetical protein
MHDQLSPDVVSFEWGSEKLGIEGYSNETTAFFKEIGVNITFIEPGSTSAQALRILPNGTFEAAGEPRQINSGGYAVWMGLFPIITAKVSLSLCVDELFLKGFMGERWSNKYFSGDSMSPNTFLSPLST